jgi:hypothetical protein
MSEERASTSGPAGIDQEMDTIIFYLTAFAHIDGTYDELEQRYIAQFITKLVAYRIRLAMGDATREARDAETIRWVRFYQDLFVETEATIQGYFTESVAEGENAHEFVFAKLKLRCYELFGRFPREHQEKLLLLAHELMNADGEVHPNEASFHDDLRALLDAKEPATLADEDVEPISDEPDDGAAPAFVIEEARVLSPRVDDYDVFREFERPYTMDRDAFASQAEKDLAIVQRAMAAFDVQRAAGRGKLAGAFDVAAFADEKPFLDDYVYVLPPEPDKDYELLVIGDLHGCYSCLKAALMQSDFFAKVDAHHLDPSKPAMKLVLLGDYIDRGQFGYQGVLRTILQLYLMAPEHVYILRGNHEYYVELNGRVYGGVRPAESISALQGVASEDVFRAYKRLFESLPNMLLFGETLFVHAGIPREDTLAEKWSDLSSLNDPEIRFQMMWSDPSEADFIPIDLQKASARFPFGKKQWKSFMARLGCNLMLRGHERIVEGFKTVHSDGEGTLLSLFSSGGSENRDLPETSNYREVTPKAVLFRQRNGQVRLTPFVLDWKKYNDPRYNRFFAEG